MHKEAQQIDQTCADCTGIFLIFFFKAAKHVTHTLRVSAHCDAADKSERV